MHSDGYELFRAYWWLIFPVLGMAMGIVQMLLRHAQSNRTIDIIRTYAEQGKEPPPEVLAALRRTGANSGEDDDWLGVGQSGGKKGHAGLWVPVFLFLGLSAGFVMLGVREPDGDNTGLFFVAFVMGGLCLGFLAMILASRGKGPPQ